MGQGCGKVALVLIYMGTGCFAREVPLGKILPSFMWKACVLV